MAALTAELIREPLRKGGLDNVALTMAGLADEHSLAAVVLYDSDGSVLASHGTTEISAPQSFMIGEHLQMSWPHLLNLRFSHVIYDNDRPVGLLMLYSAMNGSVLVALLLAGLLTALFFCLIRHGGYSPNLPIPHERGDDKIEARQLAVSGREQALRQRLGELEQQRDRALASAQAKGDFLAHVSHEIRTMMNGVVGVLAILQSAGLEGENGRLLRTASKSTDALLLIINDILDFAKIESGRIAFEKILFDLREVVEECVSLYVDCAHSKKNRLHCFLSPDIATKVLGDPTRLRQIITNLLSNAVKFTEEGEINLRVGLLQSVGGKRRFRFTVEDTGIGIEPENLENIFDVFVQATPETARKYGGTGLGLNVCKQLVELQDGEIGVDSAPGAGASFWFTMDFDIAEEHGLQHVRQNTPPVQVALFDNCETCSAIIVQYLQDCTVSIYRCDGVSAVIGHLQKRKEKDGTPDFVLVDTSAIAGEYDILMQEVRGLYGSSAPSVYILARQNGMEERHGISGIAGLIHKPINLMPLREELLGKDVGRQESEDMQSQMLRGRVLLVDDEQINRHVGCLILKKIGFDVETATNGEEALEKTAKGRYDLIFMDVQMPLMSGIEATAEIRNLEKKRGQSPQVIVAMTANTLDSTRKSCLAAGMDGFVAKPIKPDVLIHYLQSLIGRENGAPDAAPEGLVSGSIQNREELDRRPVWDRVLALDYVGGDEMLLRELMKLFLERCDNLLAAVTDAVKSGNGREISHTAHAFKGAVNHFAAARCRRIAQKIEDSGALGRLDDLEGDVGELTLATECLVEELRRQV